MTRDLVAATGGRQSGNDVEVAGISIDTRTIGPGMLFVPVLGDRDGHDFIPAALASGAAAYLTAQAPLAGTATAVLVADTALA